MSGLIQLSHMPGRFLIVPLPDRRRLIGHILQKPGILQARPNLIVGDEPEIGLFGTPV